MDPTAITNIYGLIGVCIVTLGGMVGSIIYVQRTTGRTASTSDTPTNGQPVSANFVRRIVAEHERDCGMHEDLEKLRHDMQTGFTNVGIDIRGVHERLDRVIEKRL